jgi:hypothetical protein
VNSIKKYFEKKANFNNIFTSTMHFPLPILFFFYDALLYNISCLMFLPTTLIKNPHKFISLFYEAIKRSCWIYYINVNWYEREWNLRLFWWWCWMLFSAFLQEMRSYSSLCWVGGWLVGWLVCHKTKMARTFDWKQLESSLIARWKGLKPSYKIQLSLGTKSVSAKRKSVLTKKWSQN